MMNQSDEAKKQSQSNGADFFDDRNKTSIIQYFWQSSPIQGKKRKQSLHYFLRSIEIFEDFTDYELQILSRFMHQRTFSKDELVFKQGDTAFGFYIIYSGSFHILHSDIHNVRGDVAKTLSIKEVESSRIVTTLHKGELFGELSMVSNKNKRNASVLACEPSRVLALYRPDLDEMTHLRPIIAAKFYKALAQMVANRFEDVAREMSIIKKKDSLNE